MTMNTTLNTTSGGSVLSGTVMKRESEGRLDLVAKGVVSMAGARTPLHGLYFAAPVLTAAFFIATMIFY